MHNERDSRANHQTYILPKEPFPSSRYFYYRPASSPSSLINADQNVMIGRINKYLNGG